MLLRIAGAVVTTGLVAFLAYRLGSSGWPGIVVAFLTVPAASFWAATLIVADRAIMSRSAAPSPAASSIVAVLTTALALAVEALVR